VGPVKDAKGVTVTLEREPPPPAPTPPKPTTASPPPRPIWPFVTGVAGFVAASVALDFAIQRQAVGAELDDQCGPDRNACPAGYDDGAARSREQLYLGLAVGLGAAGVLAVGAAGVALGLTDPDPSRPTTSLRIGPGSVMLQGRF